MANKNVPLPFKPKTKAQYRDQSRFPKVVTLGYEKEFVKEYIDTTHKMTKDLARKMVEIINRK